MHDDKVGYGQPPKSSRFQKGVSGNPKGRPVGKSSKSHLMILDQIFSETIKIREAGKETEVTKIEAFLKKLFADAMNGDKNSIKMILRYAEIISAHKKDSDDDLKTEIKVIFVSPKKAGEHNDDAI